MIKAENFDKVIDGKQVKLFTLKNAHGIEAYITNYGAKIIALLTPDKNGGFEDIVLGYDTIDEYVNSKEPYFGAVIGRYGNRICKGKFSLDGVDYNLAVNNGENHLHGGLKGFNAVVWDAELTAENTILFKYTSVDMEEGYPGNLSIDMEYKLTEENEIVISYTATTDKKTVVNLTHHSFFNLLGAGNGSVNDHVMQINSGAITPVDEGLIPTGELMPLEGTAFDFDTPTAIGERIADKHQQLIYGNGYDHNYVLAQPSDEDVFLAATVLESTSGRVMRVYTDQPGMQFYGGNFLAGEIGKGGKSYDFRTAFCLETQCFPDSPNQRQFPTTELNPDEEYKHICVYKFDVQK